MTRTAIELAERATRFGNARAGLVAVVSLRRRLDELEAWHVEDAIRAGLSWTQVGEALGISRQAAHKRHAAHLRGLETRSFATAARERGLEVTREARQAVRRAAEEARALGHARIGSGHLLLGLLRDRHAASGALERAGVSLGAARPLVGQISVPKHDGSAPKGSPTISARARIVLEQALREAVALGDVHVGVEHLLLAVLTDEQGVAVRVLNELGAAPAGVRKAVVSAADRSGRNVRPGA